MWLLDKLQHFRRITANDSFGYRNKYRQISHCSLILPPFVLFSTPLTFKFLFSDINDGVLYRTQDKRAKKVVKSCFVIDRSCASVYSLLLSLQNFIGCGRFPFGKTYCAIFQKHEMCIATNF